MQAEEPAKVLPVSLPTLSLPILSKLVNLLLLLLSECLSQDAGGRCYKEHTLID